MSVIVFTGGYIALIDDEKNIESKLQKLLSLYVKMSKNLIYDLTIYKFNSYSEIIIQDIFNKKNYTTNKIYSDDDFDVNERIEICNLMK